MRNKQIKPTRRKPGGPYEHGNYSTVWRYESPWWVTLYALAIVALVVGLPALLSYTHLLGWW